MTAKMWGEVTHAPYGKISIGTVRGGKGRYVRILREKETDTPSQEGK